jgi:translocator protein
VKIAKLIASVAFCFFVAVLGSMATYPSIPTWFAGLNKPFFNPPNWIFGPVWTTLYFLMGVALFLVWDKKTEDKSKKQGIRIFIYQLIFNALWSLVFFSFHQIFLAFVVIVVLWFYIYRTIKLFAKVSKPASYLLYPYILWVSFASILNYAIFILNY